MRRSHSLTRDLGHFLPGKWDLDRRRVVRDAIAEIGAAEIIWRSIVVNHLRHDRLAKIVREQVVDRAEADQCLVHRQHGSQSCDFVGRIIARGALHVQNDSARDEPPEARACQFHERE